MPTRSFDCEKTDGKTTDNVAVEHHDAHPVEHLELCRTLHTRGAETEALKLFPSADDLLPTPTGRAGRVDAPPRTVDTEADEVRKKAIDANTIVFTNDIWQAPNLKGAPDNNLVSSDKTIIKELPNNTNATSGASPEVSLPIVPPGQHPFTAATVAIDGSNGVDQTSHGDCVFESTVSAMAGTNQGRADIANMITMGQNGDYIVKFPGDANPTTVTRAEVMNQSSINDSGGWARILQAALVKSHPDFAEAKIPAGAGGGTDGNPPTSAQYAAFLLTGRAAEKIDAGDNNVTSYIQNALNSDNPITAFCKNNDNGSLVSGHEWTVTAYNPNDQTVTVRNPWGHWTSKDNDGIEDLGNGQVRMPLPTFQRNFGEVTSLGFPKPQSALDIVLSDLNPFNWIKGLV